MQYLLLALMTLVYIMPPHTTTIDVLLGIVLAMDAFIVGFSEGRKH